MATGLEWMVMVILAAGMLFPKLPLGEKSRGTTGAAMLGAGLVGTH